MLIPHNKPLDMIDGLTIGKALSPLLSPSVFTVSKDGGFLTLVVQDKVYKLPIFPTMTWGQLKNSLKEKGIINERI